MNKIEDIKTATWNICKCETCYCDDFELNMIAVEPGHFEWLIEQAKSNEWLKERTKYLGDEVTNLKDKIIKMTSKTHYYLHEINAIDENVDYWGRNVVDVLISVSKQQTQKVKELEQKNKRYREAMKKIWKLTETDAGTEEQVFIIADDILLEND